MFTPETQARIADIVRWMDVTDAPLGTETGHAKSALRAILGLYRLTDDMARVEEIITQCLSGAWHVTACDPEHMVPLFTVAEVPEAVRATPEMCKTSI